MLIAIFSLTALLFLIWPVPHTVSIREICLTVALLLSGIYIYKQKIALSPLRSLRIPIIFYLLFMAWVIIVAVFVSDDMSWALRELKSQWLWGILALILGGSIGIIIKPRLLPSVLMVLFLILLTHVAVIIVDGFNHILVNDFDNLTYVTRFTSGLTIGPIDASILCDFLLIIIIAEWLYRKTHGDRILPVESNDLLIVFSLALAGSAFCGLRNIVELAILLLFVPILYSRKSAIIALASFILLAVFFYKTDSRWSEIGESFNLASTTTYDWNIEYNQPTIEPVKGQVVNASNYLRFEKYDTGASIIRANYLGVGYGRNAFGHGLSDRYNKASGLNADSSLFDLFIGTGIVGGVLWLCFYSSLIYIAFTSFKNNKDFISCLLLLLLVTFGSRMVVDSIFRDHLMQQFLFMTGFLLTVKKEDL